MPRPAALSDSTGFLHNFEQFSRCENEWETQAFLQKVKNAKISDQKTGRVSSRFATLDRFAYDIQNNTHSKQYTACIVFPRMCIVLCIVLMETCIVLVYCLRVIFPLER